MVLHGPQQLTGINVVFYYSNSFFVGVTDKPFVGTTLVGAVNVVATYVTLELMESTGRILLMLWSVGGMLISAVVVTLTLMGNIPNIVAAFGVMTSAFFVEIGLGPVSWRFVGKTFDAREKGKSGKTGDGGTHWSNFVVF